MNGSEQAVCQILAFAGSTRSASWNKKLLQTAVRSAQKAGAAVTVIDLKDYPLPLYDGDLEEKEGIPENVKKLKSLFRSHQGFLLASPEYNSSISGVLKNTIDWVSRPMTGEKPLECFTGKIVALTSASPGALGGIRGLVPLRSLLGNIGCFILPDQVCIPKANEAFDDEGMIKDERLRQSVEKLTMQLWSVVRKMSQD